MYYNRIKDLLKCDKTYKRVMYKKIKVHDKEVVKIIFAKPILQDEFIVKRFMEVK